MRERSKLCVIGYGPARAQSQRMVRTQNKNAPTLREGLCPRCGEIARWLLVDDAKSRVEITCPQCGTFQLSRREFDEAEEEIPD